METKYVPQRRGKTYDMNTHKNMYTDVHTNILHNSYKWKQSKMSVNDKWANKRWLIIQWNISLIKNSKELTHTTKWMNFENMMFNERSQL